MTFYLGLGIGIVLGFLIFVIIFAIAREFIGKKREEQISHTLPEVMNYPEHEIPDQINHSEHYDETPPSSVSH